MTSPNRDIFEVGITLLKFIGEDVYFTSKKVILCRILNCAIQVLIGIFIFANFLNAEGGAYVNTLENMATIMHTCLKYILFMYYKTSIQCLLKERLIRFWDYKQCDQHFISQIETLYKTVKTIQISIVLGVLFCLHMYFLKPLFNERTVFLFDSEIFINSVVLEAFVLMCQYYFPCTVIPIVLGFDALYLSLCCEVIVQVKLLKYKLKQLSTNRTENPMKDVIVCIEHHLFLLSVYARMRRIYSAMLLFHYFISLVTACTDMYESFVGEVDLPNQVLKFLSVAIIFAQFAFYALPAELVAFEFSDISYAIYTSKWYQNKLPIQKMMFFIMLRSQREEFFSGAGLLHININAFGSVIRKTFSFYAIIRNLLSN